MVDDLKKALTLENFKSNPNEDNAKIIAIEKFHCFLKYIERKRGSKARNPNVKILAEAYEFIEGIETYKEAIQT